MSAHSGQYITLIIKTDGKAVAFSYHRTSHPVLIVLLYSSLTACLYAFLVFSGAGLSLCRSRFLDMLAFAMI